tara:strand:- start:59 stop:268 length:210 start_codon:yes stop_codon:yes gene_type:complete
MNYNENRYLNYLNDNYFREINFIKKTSKMNKTNAFENEIFNHFRVKEKKITEAIKLLKLNGYKVYEEKK